MLVFWSLYQIAIGAVLYWWASYNCLWCRLLLGSTKVSYNDLPIARTNRIINRNPISLMLMMLSVCILWIYLVNEHGIFLGGAEFLSIKSIIFSTMSTSLMEGCQCSFIMSSNFSLLKLNSEKMDCLSLSSMLIKGDSNGKLPPRLILTNAILCNITKILLPSSYLCSISWSFRFLSSISGLLLRIDDYH